jgi:hypothetical protein
MARVIISASPLVPPSHKRLHEKITTMMGDSPFYMSEDSVLFYTPGSVRKVIETLSPKLRVLVVDDRIDKEIGVGTVQDILYDSLSGDEFHAIIIEFDDGRVLKTCWQHVTPEM